jgi:hypothetical protein
LVADLRRRFYPQLGLFYIYRRPLLVADLRRRFYPQLGLFYIYRRPLLVADLRRRAGSSCFGMA